MAITLPSRHGYITWPSRLRLPVCAGPAQFKKRPVLFAMWKLLLLVFDPTGVRPPARLPLRSRTAGGRDNLADMFTKVLDRIPFVKLRKLVLNVVVRAATMVMPRARRSRAA